MNIIHNQMGDKYVYSLKHKHICMKSIRRIHIPVIFLFLVLSANPPEARAQFAYFNSEDFWSKLVLEKEGYVSTANAADTTIILATNRRYDTSTFRFFPEVREGGIHYFFVYSLQGKWHLIPVSTLQKAINMFPDKNRDWLLYTEGMGKFFTSDADRGMQVAAQYGINVIMMDYPSITAHRKRLGNYFFAIKNARVAYKDFVPVFDTVKMLKVSGKMGNGKLSMLFHSMGNIVMRQIVKQGKLPVINDQVWIDNLILNAACVPQRRHKKWVDKIHFAKRIYIHYNPHDFTLGGAYLVSKKNQLGMKVKRPVSKQAVYINFNAIAGKGHSNFVSLHSREPIPEKSHHHYNTLFHGNAAPVKDTSLYMPSEYKGIGYTLLP